MFISLLLEVLLFNDPIVCPILAVEELLTACDDIDESKIVGCLWQYAADWYWWKYLNIVEGEIDV